MWTRAAQVVLLVGLLPLTFGASLPDEEVRFNRDIRPILSDNCFACHGPDSGTRKAKLRLDLRDNAIEREAILPGKPDESELIKRILTSDPDDVMPPADSTKKLTAAQKALLQKWVAQGAKYEPHWAFIKPSRPAVPKVKNRAWVRNPIDAFILASLEARNIQPSSPADERTLARRLSLDLTGLPPAPEQAAKFSMARYEREVDRLLKSPHYGERMAVPWLDTVRFADTVGYHGDQNQRIFPYRDYVINSFNENKPFDQFTIEQLAGDLLPNPTREQLVATGFNRLNMMTREGGAQPKEYLAKYSADRVRAVGATWLGLTLACAECHDHKFDPTLTKDFYSMAAFFADVKQWGVYADYGYTPNPDLKGWNNDYPFPPEIQVESAYLKARAAEIDDQMNLLIQKNARRSPEDFAKFRLETVEFLKSHPSGWIAPAPLVTISAKNADSKPGATSVVLADQTVVLHGKTGDNVQIELPLPSGVVSSLRLELLPNAAPDSVLLRASENATISLNVSLKRAADEKGKRVQFYHAYADRYEPRYSNGHELIGVHEGWRVAAKSNEPHTATYYFDKPLSVAEGDKLIVNLGATTLAAFRFSVSPLAGIDAEQVNAMARGGRKAQAAFARAYLASAAPETAFAEYKKLHREKLECRDGLAWTMVTEAWEPRETRVLPRGNWQDESGEIVQPAPPQFLAASTRSSGRMNRLDLAKWIVSKENPLTARTYVNRLWRQFFGAGLSATVDDLGLQGDTPSHPELLDWLAVEFMESGWDVKHIVKLIVTSATYRQSSNLRPDLQEIDPNNRLLASQNPRRLDAEFVRDNALAIARAINLDVGGPSAFPYQPGGYYVNLQFPDRDYIASGDERQYRRGVYSHWQRTFLHPMLANFDAPSREECTAFRIVSNTPQQALTLLNDPTFSEAARLFAAQLLSSNAKNDDARIELAFQRALARAPRARELASLRNFLAEQRNHFASEHVDEAAQLIKNGIAPAAESMDPKELAAWTQLCRVILNLHETITTY